MSDDSDDDLNFRPFPTLPPDVPEPLEVDDSRAMGQEETDEDEDLLDYCHFPATQEAEGTAESSSRGEYQPPKHKRLWFCYLLR